MINQQFRKLHIHTQMWVVAMIASWDNESKIRHLLLKHIGGFERFKFVRSKVDSFFIAEFTDVIYVGHCGTRSGWAWISDFIGLLKRGYHWGIASSMDNLFATECRWIITTGKQVKIGGQSRGGANGLYCNLLLRERGCRDVESVGFAHPYIASKRRGIGRLKAAGVRHTHFDTEPETDFPSDPVDDVGSVNSRHYGTQIILYSGAGPFDHSYSQITKNMIERYLKGGNIFDAEYLALLDTEIIKK